MNPAWLQLSEAYPPGFESFEQQRRIGAAESEGIGKSVLDARLTRRVGRVIEIAVRIGSFVIDGWGEHPAFGDKGCNSGFRCAGSAEEMADYRLCRTHGNFVRVIAEQSFYRNCLDLVVWRRRCTMGVDIDFFKEGIFTLRIVLLFSSTVGSSLMETAIVSMPPIVSTGQII